jgi:hypothetical protein
VLSSRFFHFRECNNRIPENFVRAEQDGTGRNRSLRFNTEVKLPHYWEAIYRSSRKHVSGSRRRLSERERWTKELKMGMLITSGGFSFVYLDGSFFQ